MSIGATEATTSSGTTTGNGLGVTTDTSTSKDKDMFMQLLVAQMKYQDPTSPTDSTQYLTQSAQFSMLEKLDSLATGMTSLLSGQMSFGASALVGRTVSWKLDDGTEGTGTVDTVEFGSSGPILKVGSTDVPIGSVSSVTSGTTGTTP